jgi:hypothetical protein
MMKKKNMASATVIAAQKVFPLIDDALLKTRIYTIRGVKTISTTNSS